jgi:hypothetical protein
MIFDPSPVRLPDVASIEAVLARLDPASVDADIIPALAVTHRYEVKPCFKHAGRF